METIGISVMVSIGLPSFFFFAGKYYFRLFKRQVFKNTSWEPSILLLFCKHYGNATFECSLNRVCMNIN